MARAVADSDVACGAAAAWVEVQTTAVREVHGIREAVAFKYSFAFAIHDCGSFVVSDEALVDSWHWRKADASYGLLSY